MSRTTDEAIDHQNAEAAMQDEWHRKVDELNAGWPDVDFAKAVETINSRGMLVVTPKMYLLAMNKRGVN